MYLSMCMCLFMLEGGACVLATGDVGENLKEQSR